MALFADLSSLSAMTKEKAGKNMEEAQNYIALDLGNIAKCIRPYHPLEVLKMAAWEERRLMHSRAKDPESQLMAHLLPVLLQSVVQSTIFDVSDGMSSNRAIKQKDWNRLLSLTEDMVRRILRYIDAYTVFTIRSGRISEEDGEEYRNTIFSQLFPPAESEDSILRSVYVWYGSIASESAKCRELFGVDPETLANGLYKVSIQGLTGIDKLTEDISVYKAEMMLIMAQKRSDERYASKSEDELRDIIVHEEGWEGRVSRLAGQRDDFDLFRPEFAADLPGKAYETLSVYPGTLDIMEYLKKGIWPATVFPFLRFGSMYYSFVSSHILFYGERILAENASLYLTDTEAAYNACSMIFTNTGVPDVYSFDGNKIDIHVMSSLTEVNAFLSPEFYEDRLRRRQDDMLAKPQPGHKLLFVDPDGFSDLQKISDGIFLVSAYHLFKAVRDKETRTSLLRDIFGTLDLGEADEETKFFEAAEEDLLDYSAEGDEPLDDTVSDEYEYDEQDDDEKARTLEEKEKELEEDMPAEYDLSSRSEEIRALQDKYELTEDIIEKDEEQEREADEYERELDDDDYLYDDQESDEDLDDAESEAEEIYDEAEKDDEYDNQTAQDDSDQLSFLDELLSETESEIDAAEEESLYMKEADEAEEFSRTDSEKMPSDEIEMASEEDEADDPLRDDVSLDIQIPTYDVSETPEVVLPVPFDDTVPSIISAVVSDEPVEEDGQVESFQEESRLCNPQDEFFQEDEESSDSPDQPDVAEAVPEGTEAEDLEEESETEEITTESLIDKGIVRKVETEDGQSVFVMSGSAETPVAAVEDEDDEEEETPSLSLDGILEEIASHLSSKGAFMGFVSSAESDMLDYLSRVIRASWEKQQADGKDKMFSVFDYSISVILASPNAVRDELRKEELLNNAGAVMYSKHREEWNALVLVINSSYELEDAFETVITPSSFSPSNWKICTIIGEQLIQRGK